MKIQNPEFKDIRLLLQSAQYSCTKLSSETGGPGGKPWRPEGHVQMLHREAQSGSQTQGGNKWLLTGWMDG